MLHITIPSMHAGLTYGLVPWRSLLYARLEDTLGLPVSQTG